MTGQGLERYAAEVYASGGDPLTFTEAALATYERYTTGLSLPVAAIHARRLIAIMLELGWRAPGQQQAGNRPKRDTGNGN